MSEQETKRSGGRGLIAVLLILSILVSIGGMGFLGWRVVKLVFLHVLRDLHELLAGLLPVLEIIITAVVTQFVRETLQLIDCTLLR